MLEAVAQAYGAIKVGSPTEPGTLMGPVISAAQRERCERYVELAQEHGGKVATGGGRPAGLDRGYYFEPTVLDVPDNSNPAARDEIFGPVLSVIGYEDLDDAVRIANDSAYGLSAQVYGEDVAAATSVARRFADGCGQREHGRLQRLRAGRRLQGERPRPRTRHRWHPGLPGGQTHGDRRTAALNAKEEGQ